MRTAAQKLAAEIDEDMKHVGQRLVQLANETDEYQRVAAVVLPLGQARGALTRFMHADDIKN